MSSHSEPKSSTLIVSSSPISVAAVPSSPPSSSSSSSSISVTPVGAAEYRIAHKWDACVENSLVKTGYGLLGGAAIALMLFRTPVSRSWVTAFAGGIGAGMSWVECKQTFAQRNSTPQLSKFELPKLETDSKTKKH